MAWTGFHYDGRTAHREPVWITVTAAGIEVTRSDGDSTLWPFAGIRQTQGKNRGEQLRLETGTDPVESIVVNEPGLPEAIRQVSPRAARGLSDAPELLRVFQWTAGAILTAIVVYIWVIPALAAFVAPRIPLAWEKQMGEAVVTRMAPSGNRCERSPEVDALRSVLNRLVAAGPDTPYEFTMLVVDDSVVNAFAAPGGYVVVNSGLLQAARTPEELAGVLAHEIQHVIQRHPTRGLVREVPLRLALAVISSGSEGVEMAARAAGTLGSMRYRRGDELEADREGMLLLQRANVDPAGMVDFMRTLDARHSRAPRMVSYLSTHPHTADRIDSLERLARQATYQPQPLMSAETWAAARAVCEVVNAD